MFTTINLVPYQLMIEFIIYDMMTYNSMRRAAGVLTIWVNVKTMNGVLYMLMFIMNSIMKGDNRERCKSLHSLSLHPLTILS